MQIGKTMRGSSSAMALLATLGAATPGHTADADAVATLLGSWGGSGRITYTDGSNEGIRCAADYTGGGKDLHMSIRCKSDRNPIEIRSKLKIDGGRASGEWEERTFNASGSATGTAGAGTMTLKIEGGGFTGTMSVSFSKSSHNITVTAQGVAMSRATMSFARR